ncbi:Alpha-1,2-mannosyltransferase MNN5 [Seminavis robusta]|uniref:Alpha-1,2-mannosyltransferase MNN5 n=1 Tax=Seminavis robusta TaxID=568900 RepID=A0A9N8EM60_9STRA|nr:Alpha-1,2-mannosyltransferase MNN5 [Seminavis robusta]|eukprot:Sro1443_g273120.1 Alpha-1,2-mannosyltransferase MNN5 (580) ;mRNA; f:2386-4125
MASSACSERTSIIRPTNGARSRSPARDKIAMKKEPRTKDDDADRKDDVHQERRQVAAGNYYSGRYRRIAWATIAFMCWCLIQSAMRKPLPTPGASLDSRYNINSNAIFPFVDELETEFNRNSDAHIDNLQCISWRATVGCTPDGPHVGNKRTPSLQGFFHRDWPCAKKLPALAGGSGYCEMQTETGEMVKVFQKGCYEGYPLRTAKFTASFSCDMAASFLKYKNRMMNFKPTEPMAFSGYAVPSRGIVMQVFGKVLPSAYSIVRILRDVHGCDLPIELWSLAGEVTKSDPVVRQLLDLPDINLRTIHDTSIKSYMSKLYSIVYSQFDQVLWLDSDNFPFRDPSFLFETAEFEQTGSMFWKDYWKPQQNDFYITKHSLAWELFDIPPDSPIRNEMELEAGQFVIDRRRTKKALHALLFLTLTFKEIIQPLDILLGDKDLFKFAFHATKTPFHYIEKPPGYAGYAAPPLMRSDAVCGQTMIQPDPAGDPLFFHRNMAKIGSRKALKRVWEKGLMFKNGNSEAEYHTEMWPSLWRLCMCFYPKNPSIYEELDFGEGSEVEQFEEKLLFYADEALSILDNEKR